MRDRREDYELRPVFPRRCPKLNQELQRAVTAYTEVRYPILRDSLLQLPAIGPETVTIALLWRTLGKKFTPPPPRRPVRLGRGLEGDRPQPGDQQRRRREGAASQESSLPAVLTSHWYLYCNARYSPKR